MTGPILAKSSGETLSEHTISCLCAARALLASLPLTGEERERIEEDVLTAVAMHDLGKAATGFQRVLRGEQKDWQGKRHEIISASLASSLEGISPAAIFAILTHHRSIPSDGISQIFGCLPWEQIPLLDDAPPLWREMVQEWKENCDLLLDAWRGICEYIRRDFAFQCYEPDTLSLAPSWLERSTGKRGQRKSLPFQDRYHASVVRGLVIASDHLGSAHQIPPTIPRLSGFSALKQCPRPFQARIGEFEAPAILRAPTGSGKTEAALLWAQKNQRPNGRLFYVLPYTASINAMHRRLATIFGYSNVGLLHHRAAAALYSMLEAQEDLASRLNKQDVAKTLTDLTHELWFPIRVCTPHQILRYALRGKGWEAMLSEFPNACFIFDEFHAYDPRVVGLTLAAAQLFGQLGARPLFLSATLPAFLRNLITDAMGDLPFVEPDPGLELDRAILDKKRHVMEVKDGSLRDYWQRVTSAVRSGSSTLIVCNHVKTSQEIYIKLKEEFPGEQIRLLHGRFNQEDRNRIESEIIGKPLPKVLVATQVVEVSLDVDFEQGFFEPAHIDALVQRMGRVNRSGSRPPQRVTVFARPINPYPLYCTCAGESHEPDCRVSLTLEELRKLPNPVGEKDLVAAADRVYGDGYLGEDKVKFDQGLHHPDIEEFEGRLLAGAHQDWVEAIIEKTDGVVEILPKCLVETYQQRREEGLWIEANSLLVPVRTNSLNRLKPRIDASVDPWVGEFTYCSDLGLGI